MSHIGKFTVSATLLIPLALGGCRPSKGTANPEDYFPLIQVALGGGETAAMIGRNEAIKAKNFAGCVASESLISGFDSANQVLAAKLADKIVIPAVEIDVSECLALREAPSEDDAVGESAYGPVTINTRVAGYAVVMAPEEEVSAKEAPSTETAPAEEPKVEEAKAEEPKAEEPKAETAPVKEPEEEVPSLEGHPDAAAMIETIAGITMAAVLHYAVKLQSANCKKGTAALGVLNYINGMIKPIADEIAEPDGIVSVPAVTIDLSECSNG